MKTPDLGTVEWVAIGTGVAIAGYLVYKAVGAIGDGAKGLADIASRAGDSIKEDWNAVKNKVDEVKTDIGAAPSGPIGSLSLDWGKPPEQDDILARTVKSWFGTSQDPENASTGG